MMSETAGLIKAKRKELGLSVKEVVAQLQRKGFDVNEKTLYGWENGHRQPDADKFIALCEIYHISDFPGADTCSAPSLSPAAQSLARSYDELDEHGKAVMDAVLAEETKRMHPAPVIQMKDIPMIQSSLAAGVPEPDFGLVWETYSVPADTRADFAARINGDSMEPYIKDGSVVLGLRCELRSGDVGAFLLNGEFLCKQYVKTADGAWLRSLNRDRADTDIVLNGEHSLICFGKVITEGPVPVVER